MLFNNQAGSKVGGAGNVEVQSTRVQAQEIVGRA